MQPPDLDAAPAPFAVLRRFQRGALIVAAGIPGRTVYLLRKGQVRVFQVEASGRETTTAVLGPGQLIGIEPLLGQRVYHACVEALTPVEAWALPVDRLREYLSQDPALLSHVVDALARRLALAEALLRDVLLLPVAARVPDAVAHLEMCLGDERPRFTRELLAGLVGARRETVSRALAHVPLDQRYKRDDGRRQADVVPPPG